MIAHVLNALTSVDHEGVEPFWQDSASLDMRQTSASDPAFTNIHNSALHMFQHPNASRPASDVFTGEGDTSLGWYNRGFSDAELFDAAGGIMIQNNSDTFGKGFDYMPWVSP